MIAGVIVAVISGLIITGGIVATGSVILEDLIVTILGGVWVIELGKSLVMSNRGFVGCIFGLA